MTGNPVFIPGPTNIPARLRRAMDVPTHDHRAPDFAARFQPLLADLRLVFRTETADILVFPATGTGAWEAAITNTLSPGDTVLAARHGVFSQRWIDLCRGHGLDVQLLESDWRESVPSARIADALAADTAHRIKAVIACHNETATGVTSDIGAIRTALDALDHPALLLVDGVSSIASMDFRMDDWGVDIAVTGSQKGFMLAPGLAIAAVGPRAWAATEHARCGRAFFDFQQMRSANRDGGFPYTPPIGLIQGLTESLAMLQAEGLDQVFARHHRIAEGVRRAVAAWGLSLYAARAAIYSDTVSAVVVPAGFDATALVDHAYARYGISFGAGLGPLAGRVFRIGHLGQLSEATMLSGIAVIEMAMRDLDYPIVLGAGVAAAQAYYRSAERPGERAAA